MEEAKYNRPSWDDYFFEITESVSRRGTCDRGRAGAVIARDKRILSTGYVGSPIGSPHCDDIGHEMHIVKDGNGKETQHCIRTSHAEQNVIVQAARNGIALEGATLYCKMTPCYTCAKMIINAGIVRVVALKDYHTADRTKGVFKEAGVQFDLRSSEIVKYNNQ
ncbi:cell division protein DedD [Candidatus Wolfebacteria bacterium]|nr:MAG: cell division protein DedD [Candidatus Wolfebacteria bacterium]